MIKKRLDVSCRPSGLEGAVGSGSRRVGEPLRTRVDCVTRGRLEIHQHEHPSSLTHLCPRYRNGSFGCARLSSIHNRHTNCRANERLRAWPVQRSAINAICVSNSICHVVRHFQVGNTSCTCATNSHNRWVPDQKPPSVSVRPDAGPCASARDLQSTENVQCPMALTTIGTGS